jgi:cold shock CspA family protein
MRAKIIATAAGVVLAVGGVGLAQSSFASERPATPAATESAAGWEVGIVKFYNDAKGYGFITYGASVLFFSGNDVWGGLKLAAGQVDRFQARISGPNGARAYDVHPLRS